jgi:hypothetical protein
MNQEQLAARSDAAGGRGVDAEGGGPYVTAVMKTAEPEANLIDQTLAATHAPWVRPLSCYERKETTIVEGLRYG